MEPLHGAGEVHKAQKRDIELVIAGGDTAKNLHALEEVFDTPSIMPLLSFSEDDCTKCQKWTALPERAI